MKEFDLDAALNGEPVKLACGKKAYVFYDLSRYYELSEYVNGLPLNGIVMHEDNWEKKYHANWSLSGESIFDRDSIIGMWEEPKLTSEQVLEKAYQENLPLDAIGKKAFVIAKTKDGDYVMQCGEDNLYFASHKTEWEFYKDPVPKSDTITVTLPKPFKPKDGEVFYYIYEYGIGCVKFYKEDDDGDAGLAENAQCYRTREDAQKWLDFMKSMME